MTVQAPVEAALAQQFLVGALLSNATVIEYEHPIGLPHRAQPVRAMPAAAM